MLDLMNRASTYPHTAKQVCTSKGVPNGQPNTGVKRNG